MTVENRRQCENTRKKLVELEQLYQLKRREQGGERMRELTLLSLKKRINQFKEEIARFEARTTSTARNK